MSNVLKGIGKRFTKVLKKAAPIIMVAAMIYTAGAAAGAWGVGAGASSGAGLAATSGEIGSGLSLTGGGGGLTSGLATTTGAGAIDATVSGLSTGVGGASTTAAAAPTLAASGAGTGAATGASLKGAANSMLGFIESHPAATMMAGNMLQSAFTPSEAETQAEIERNRRENSTIYGVGYGGQGPGIQLGKLGVLANTVGRQQRPATPGVLQRFKGA